MQKFCPKRKIKTRKITLTICMQFNVKKFNQKEKHLNEKKNCNILHFEKDSKTDAICKDNKNMFQICSK